jgi:hypothetical protein
MLPVHAFYGILGLCCFYAWWRGGGPEQAGAAIFLVSAVLTTLLLSTGRSRYASVETAVLFVDLAMLAALVVLALRADRFWPLWVAALQAIGTAGHAAKMVDPLVIRSGYALILALWSYPMLLLLVLGAWRHRRRLGRFGVDRSWSTSSARSARKRGAGPTG